MLIKNFYRLYSNGSAGKESTPAMQETQETWVQFPREGNGNPLQYSCLEKSMDRGAWWATAHGVARSWTRLSAKGPATATLQNYRLYCVSQIKL